MSQTEDRICRSRSDSFVACVAFACLLLPGTVLAAPSITLSKKIGPPTSEIFVSGSGFEPNVGVDIYFDTKDEALVVTNREGEFHNAKIHAPREARPGEHWVTALERNNDKGDQEPFVVYTNWSQYHFDSERTGFNPYENVLGPDNVSDLSVRWSFAIWISSSLAVVNGNVYIGSSALQDNIYALDARTGAVLWKQATGSVVLSSPAVADGILYIGSCDNNLYALNAKTGNTLWKYTTGDCVESSPTVDRGVVYVGSDDDNMYALDAKTGILLWKYTADSKVLFSPAIVKDVLYAGSDTSVYALNARTGALLWIYDVAPYIRSAPAVANGVIYFGSNDNNLYALNASTGALIWRYSTGNSVESSPAVANGVVYFSSDDGNIYALEASTGVLLWRYPTFSSSPTVANGVVYAVDHGPLALNAKTGALLFSYFISGAGATTPAVTNGVMYFGFQGAVYAFSLNGSDSSEPLNLTGRPKINLLHPDLKLQPSRSLE